MKKRVGHMLMITCSIKKCIFGLDILKVELFLLLTV